MTSGYAVLNDMKDRLLIDTSVTTYDDALNSAGNEASAMVDMFLKPYVTAVPLTSGTNPTNTNTMIQVITSDFAVSIFKRRMMPEDVRIKPELTPDNLQQMEAQGWFAQGYKKMQEFIKNYYTLAQGISGSAAGEQIINGGLEAGDFTGWVTSGSYAINNTTVRTGEYSAKLDSSNPTYSWMQQTLQVPLLRSQIDTCTFYARSSMAGGLRVIVRFTDLTFRYSSVSGIATNGFTQVDIMALDDDNDSSDLIPTTKTLMAIEIQASIDGSTIYVDDLSLITLVADAPITNPNIWIELLKRGIVTAKEARKYIDEGVAVINSIVDHLTKTLLNVEVHTITKTVIDLQDRYHTDRQKSFAFVQSDEDSDGYEQQPTT